MTNTGFHSCNNFMASPQYNTMRLVTESLHLTKIKHLLNYRIMKLIMARWQGGGCAGCARTPPPPKSQKGPPDEIVKYLKWCKTNVVEGMTIWMHFQQFEDLKFLFFFSGGACPWTSLKPLQSVQLSQITRDCPDSS